MSARGFSQTAGGLEPGGQFEQMTHARGRTRPGAAPPLPRHRGGPAVAAGQIAAAVQQLCRQASRQITPEARAAFATALTREDSPLARDVLAQILDNGAIAQRRNLPYCQDTGMTTVFVRRGANVSVTDGTLTEAIQAGVRASCRAGYLRPSVVADPLRRVNTFDNTPAIIHVEEVGADELSLWVMPRGFGGENTSRLTVLTPADGWAGIVREVVATVRAAGASACPPLIVGVGLGGTFEYAAYLAKRALLRPVGRPNPDPDLAGREQDLLAAINATGLGAGGVGGTVTAVAVHLDVYATHISSLPVAVNLGCHAHRIGRVTLLGKPHD